MDSNTQKALHRVRRLLASEATGIDVEETSLLVPANDVGALSGVGFVSRKPDVHVSVYVFESQREHQAAIEKLRIIPASDTSYVVHASNGSLLFFGYTDSSGANGDPMDAEERLDRLVQAFAGEE